MKCDCCKQDIKREEKSCGTGYGVYEAPEKKKKLCYECCAAIDIGRLLKTGKGIMYLCISDEDEKIIRGMRRIFGAIQLTPSSTFITNWPGSLKCKAHYLKKGRHNIAGNRYDVWFVYAGQNFHGVTYGDMTQICHVKRIKD
jgi:hypothetical protein